MSFWKKEEPQVTPAPEELMPSQPNTAEAVSAASNMIEMKLQAEAMVDMFHRMSTTCFSKCLGKHKDTLLNVAEQSCVDRCVVKYLESQNVVAVMLRNNLMGPQSEMQ